MDRLIELIRDKKNPTALGLDTRLDYLPADFAKDYDLSTFKGVCKAIRAFNYTLIDTVCDMVPAVKVQVAYYEMYGVPGMKVFADTMEYAKKRGMYVVADIKRNDIGATSTAYSTAYLGRTALGEGKTKRAFKPDCITLNPYLGVDGIQPFLEDARAYDRDMFILVKTSNPSSVQLQDLQVTQAGAHTLSQTLYEVVADLVCAWGKDQIGAYGYSRVGAVVGATHPEQGAQLRKRMPHAFFLLPGYGAQGATAAGLCGCFDAAANGAIVNASRSLQCAWKKHPHMNFVDATRAEAIAMREDILGALRGAGKSL